MYSFPNFVPVHCSMYGSNCCFLTCIQVSQEAGKRVWNSHLFQNFPQFVVIHTIKGFSIVNEAGVFLEFSCFFCDPMDVGIWFLVPLPFLNPACIPGSSRFTYCWSFENFEHYFASVWNECNFAEVWAFFGIAFLWHWNEDWPFPVLWPLLSFPNVLAYWVQHFHSIIL